MSPDEESDEIWCSVDSNAVDQHLRTSWADREKSGYLAPLLEQQRGGTATSVRAARTDESHLSFAFPTEENHDRSEIALLDFNLRRKKEISRTRPHFWSATRLLKCRGQEQCFQRWGHDERRNARYWRNRDSWRVDKSERWSTNSWYGLLRLTE